MDYASALRDAHFDRGMLRFAQDDGAVVARGVFNTFRKNGAVRLTRFFATCSGVPQATTSPPASPASGPRSTM